MYACFFHGGYKRQRTLCQGQSHLNYPLSVSSATPHSDAVPSARAESPSVCSCGFAMSHLLRRGTAREFRSSHLPFLRGLLHSLRSSRSPSCLREGGTLRAESRWVTTSLLQSTEGRNECRACRLSKCLSVGMHRERVYLQRRRRTSVPRPTLLDTAGHSWKLRSLRSAYAILEQRRGVTHGEVRLEGTKTPVRSLHTVWFPPCSSTKL